jgi:hypothetical protein
MSIESFTSNQDTMRLLLLSSMQKKKELAVSILLSTSVGALPPPSFNSALSQLLLTQNMRTRLTPPAPGPSYATFLNQIVNHYSFPPPTSSPQACLATLLASATMETPKPQPNPQVVNKNLTQALKTLGSSLRQRSDPYIDCVDLDIASPKADKFKSVRGGVAETFQEKLQRMLKDTEEEGLTNIVSFLPHGRAFRVHDVDRFVKEIMPRYFNQSKWSSFTRQLNLWGFLRITTGPDVGGFYHELFLKGRPNLCTSMMRVGVSKGVDRRKSRPTTKGVSDPNFYSMKPSC